MVQAEALLRTITGISDVRIVAHPAGGIAVVRVQRNDAASVGQVVRNIRSALFAGFGISISPECIDFPEFDNREGNAGEATVAKPAGPACSTDKPAEGPARVYADVFPGAKSKTPPAVAQPATRGYRIISPLPSASSPAAYHASELAVMTGTVAQPLRIPRILQVVAAAETEQPAETASQQIHTTTSAVGATVRDIVVSAAALRLESVEMRRQSGRLRCRVVISLGSDHFGAVADSTDPTAGEIVLAGRVACDALRAGGFTEARFDGAAVAQINGREHVVVALSEWMGGETMVLSGAAPVEELPERAAAIAAIKAVLAQDIN